METSYSNKYGKDNIFLNSLNDITRDAYKTDTRSTVTEKPVNRFETDVILNSKEYFDSNNQQINSMQEEIISLKNKLKTIYEKEEEIHKLKMDRDKLEKEIEAKDTLVTENNKLRIENKHLRDKNDEYQIVSMNLESLEQENTMLKTKLEGYHIDSNDSNKSPDKNPDKNDDQVSNVENKIKIDVVKLKNVLHSRLKSYHENHIDGIILQYDLYGKESIDKETMEKILLEAIHI